MTQRAKRRALRRKQEQQRQKRLPQITAQKTSVLSGDSARTVGLEELRRSFRAIQDFRLNPRVFEEALARAARALSSPPISRPNRYDPSHPDFIASREEMRSRSTVQLWQLCSGTETTIEFLNGSTVWRFPIPVSSITISRPVDNIATIELSMVLNHQHWTVRGNRLWRLGLEESEIYGAVITARRLVNYDLFEVHTGHRYLSSELFEIDFRVIPQRINENFDAVSFEVAPPFERRDRSEISARSRRPKACQGCSYYHAPAYPGDTLICAVHPEGSQSESCPDWMPIDVARSLPS